LDERVAKRKHARINGRKGHFFSFRDHAPHNPAWQLINVFVERLWRSLKYECAYLCAWEGWIMFYNNKRPHSAIGGKPPPVIYCQRIETSNPD